MTAIEWHCICGAGDNAEWHSLMCVAHNTPDDYWHSDGEPGQLERRPTAEEPTP